jgi:hypothetical protein
MSARKLGRLAGLVFVLAAVFGGIGVASDVARHEAGVILHADYPGQMLTLDLVWV